MVNLDKYLQMATDLGMVDGRIISPADIFFDPRAILKCRWGCDDFFKHSIKCSVRDTSFQERIEMIKAYRDILLLRGHDGSQLSKAVLEIERAAFLDGHYFAFAIRYCRLCPNCALDRGEECPTPDKVRPCDEGFGIDMFKTVRNQGLPCEVLQAKDEPQNRYGFVLIS